MASKKFVRMLIGAYAGQVIETTKEAAEAGISNGSMEKVSSAVQDRAEDEMVGNTEDFEPPIRSTTGDEYEGAGNGETEPQTFEEFLLSIEGVGPATVNKIVEAEFENISQIAEYDVEDFLEEVSVKEDLAKVIIEMARQADKAE